MMNKEYEKWQKKADNSIGCVNIERKQPGDDEDWSEFVWDVVTDAEHGKAGSFFTCKTQWQAHVLSELVQIKAILLGRVEDTYSWVRMQEHKAYVKRLARYWNNNNKNAEW